MLTLQCPPIRTPKAPKREQAITAERVQELLREITFALHATRVVGWVGEAVKSPPRLR